MCGIFGAITLLQAIPLSGRLEQVSRLLHHRGPDDTGLWTLGNGAHRVDLGQTRLSIIDLSPGGHQPMVSADGRHVLTFNGEIYNYKELRIELQRLGCVFRSASDTEVLLQAWETWGEGCIPRLRGMFAFAMWDSRERRLTCVRDAFGIKPLFYANLKAGFYFASELPALHALVGETMTMNSAVMLDYLVRGRYDIGTETFFAGCERLEAGHVLRVLLDDDAMQIEVERWWWPSIEEDTGVSFRDAVAGVRERFVENIRLHLRSDVAIGVALSGGVDSSSIASAVRYIEPEMPISTFSFVAPGSPVNEEMWVDSVNEHVRASPHKVIIQANELADDLDTMIMTQGEPFGSTSIYAQYRVYQSASESGVKVMLDGQGADELFAGYDGYPTARVRSLLRSGDLVGWARLLSGWSEYPRRSAGQWLQHSVAAIAPQSFMPYMRRVSGRDRRPAWADARAFKRLETRIVHQELSRSHWDGRSLAGRLREALTQGEMGVLLRHGDRNSMRWSIESRVPFLTTDFAEYSLRLPETYLLSPRGETKHVFRAAMRGIVPDAILDRRDKVGFETPETYWLRALRPRVPEWLEGLDSIPFVDASAARMHVDGALSGRRPFTWQIWRLINASRWVQVNHV